MRTVEDKYVEVSYLCMAIRVEDEFTQHTSAGGSGLTRMWLSELPAWLLSRPGAMIVSVREG